MMHEVVGGGGGVKDLEGDLGDALGLKILLSCRC